MFITVKLGDWIYEKNNQYIIATIIDSDFIEEVILDKNIIKNFVIKFVEIYKTKEYDKLIINIFKLRNYFKDIGYGVFDQFNEAIEHIFPEIKIELQKYIILE